MPKRKSAEDEIDDLVDDLEELDEDEDVEEIEEDEEDPDEAPKARRTRKTKARKAKVEREGIGTKEVAEFLGIEPRQLRMFLRAREFQPKDNREGRYHWSSLEDPEVKRIVKEVQAGELEKLNKEKLASLKGRSEKKTTAKKTTARKRKVAK